VLTRSSKRLARIGLTGRLGRRGDEVSCHWSSRRAAMAGRVLRWGKEKWSGGGGPALCAMQRLRERGGCDSARGSMGNGPGVSAGGDRRAV
jgi:hypothetical protein